MLEIWAPTTSLTVLKSAWKMDSLLAVAMAKHCTELILLYINN